MQGRTPWLVIPLALALAACGGSSSTAGGSSGTTGGTALQAATGTITGFGSVVIDGVEYDDSGATVSRDTDPAHPIDATLDDLHIGQQVMVTFANGAITHVSILASVIGKIDAGSINPNDAGTTNPLADSFTVDGQTVVFTTTGADATAFDGVDGAAQLADGQLVEVFGTLDASGHVVATRIVVMPPGGATVVRVAGIVQNTNATAATFTLGTLTVSYGSATLVPSGATIQDGEKVFVFSDQLPGGNPPTLTARSIFVPRAALASRPVLVGGAVTSVTPVTGQALPNFTVNGYTVDASQASLVAPATAADLVVNAFVRVEGTFANDQIQATRIAILPSMSRPAVLLIGAISSVDTTATTFVVRGTTVGYAQATFVNGTAAQLVPGALVFVHGHVGSSGVVADQIMFDTGATPPAPAATVVHLMGTVSGLSGTTFTVDGQTVDASHAQIVPVMGGGTTLANGKLVRVDGTVSGGTVVATTVYVINFGM